MLNFDQFGSFADCEPCPSNGECYRGKLECVRGYRKQGRLCVEDGDINETAKKLVCPKKPIHSGILMCWGYKNP